MLSIKCSFSIHYARIHRDCDMRQTLLQYDKSFQTGLLFVRPSVRELVFGFKNPRRTFSLFSQNNKIMSRHLTDYFGELRNQTDSQLKDPSQSITTTYFILNSEKYIQHI